MFRRLSRWAAAVPLSLALAAGLSGCGSTDSAAPAASSASSSAPSGGQALTVFAAASLTETFTELGKTFEAAHPGAKVTFNFGSSATLAQQITQGAPADVFAAASPATMKTVTDSSLAAGPVTFVRNQLQIAVPADNPAKVADLKDLADTKVKVALCAAQVPCGAAAVKALDAAGLKVTPVTFEQDVKATLTKVELGEVDAALVYTHRRAGGRRQGRGHRVPRGRQGHQRLPDRRPVQGAPRPSSPSSSSTWSCPRRARTC